jgi:osmoprotectant transport system ATP-binding protein
MQTMLRDLLHRVNKTTLIVTHDLEEALYLADRIVLLESGHIVADLPSTEVRASQNPAVQAYVAATHRETPTPQAALPTNSQNENPKQNWWELS